MAKVKGLTFVANAKSPVVSKIPAIVLSISTGDPAATSTVITGGDTATVQLTVTVPGAAVGDPVAVGFSTTTNAKVIVGAQVTAADTVTVTFVNCSATAVLNLASGTLKLVIFQIAA